MHGPVFFKLTPAMVIRKHQVGYFPEVNLNASFSNGQDYGTVQIFLGTVFYKSEIVMLSDSIQLCDLASSDRMVCHF